MKNIEMEVLMADGCTEAEAQRHIERGAVVIEKGDFLANFAVYMQEWGVDEDEQQEYRRMVDEGKPVTDWGVVLTEERTYYIKYVL